MPKKVAIIIPAFNAEKYIAKCLDSILSQSYRDFSIYVIDDGSFDTTADIVSSYEKNDGLIRLITTENHGPAAARNTGLEHVRGNADYIMFCDADDELCPDAVEKLVRRAEETGSDLVLAGFTIINSDGTRNAYSEPCAMFTPETLGIHLADLYKSNLLNQVWAKIFSASLIYDNAIRFQDCRWGEDRLFIFDCLEYISAASVESSCIYKYIMHPDESLISGFYSRKAEICVLSDNRIRKLCEKYGAENGGYFRYMFVKSIFSCLTSVFSSSCPLSSAEKHEYIRRIISDDDIVSRCHNVSGGIAAKFISAVISTRSVPLNMAAARFTVFAGKIMPGIYQKIKHKK